MTDWRLSPKSPQPTITTPIIEITIAIKVEIVVLSLQIKNPPNKATIELQKKYYRRTGHSCQFQRFKPQSKM